MPEFINIKLNGTIHGIGGGLNTEIKQALLNCFAHVAWIDAQGQTYYDALEAALYPPANLVSITAVFNQGSTVIYDNQSLDDLKQYLTVTAHYDNGTMSSVTNYTLSGTLATGTSTITVSYGGKTATFNVTVTHAVTQYTITNALTNVTNSNAATVINENLPYSGTLTADNNYVIATVTVMMGNADITATAYNSETGVISIASVTGNVTITAVAVEDVGWISGVAYDSDAINISEGGYRINTSTGEVYEYDSSSNRVTDFIPCRGASAIVLSSGRLLQNVFYYDENKVFISAPQGNTGIENPCPVPTPRNAAYFRMCANTTEPTIIPYLYDTLPGNTQYELGKHYVFDWTEAHDTKYSPYVLCLLATELKVGTTSRIFTYFYDYEGTQIYGDAHTGTTLITVPEGAKTMRLWFSTTSGILDNDWFMFTS